MCDAESPCASRDPVSVVGQELYVGPGPLPGLPVACSEPADLGSGLVHGSLGHMWLRGIGYERLRSELADGYYPDDTVNP